MFNRNSILKEMKDVPADRLEELYQFVHSLTPKAKNTESQRKKILSFGGAFADMDGNSYSGFINETIKTRTKLFDRDFDL
jgi:hypothetical protein